MKINMETNLSGIIDRFTKAEDSLRTLLHASDLLEKSRKELEASRNALETRDLTAVERLEIADTALKKSENALMDTSSQVHALTREMADVARDLKDVSLSLRGLKPDRLFVEIGEIKSEIRSLKKQTIIIQVLATLFLFAGGYWILTNGGFL